MKVEVVALRVRPGTDWLAQCDCGEFRFLPGWKSAMEWAWGHIVFTHQGESHRPPDRMDPWAEDNVPSF